MGEAGSPSVTVLLDRLSAGKPGAFADLVDAVYDDVRRMASGRIDGADAGRDVLVQPTVIAHDVLMAFGNQRNVPTNSEHFFAIAATMVMRILADYRKSRLALKRGGGVARVAVEHAPEPAAPAVPEAGADEGDDEVDRALAALRTLHEAAPRQAEIASLRLYSNHPVARIAVMLNLSESTVNREWREAKTFLARCARGAES